MFKGQFITIFQIFLTSLLTVGCWSTQKLYSRALVIFIEDGRFGEISCTSALTSHPRSGVRQLCQYGAFEVEYTHDYLNLNEALSDWFTPYQNRMIPSLYFDSWSTQLFPSSPEILTQSNIEIGFESVIDQFPIHHGLWYLDSSQVIQVFLQADSLFAAKTPRYQVITFSDLAFQESKHTTSKDFELHEKREEIWESVDESIYQLLSSINFSKTPHDFTIAVLGIAKNESIGSGIIFTHNKGDQKQFTQASSIEKISILFHKLIKPDLLVTETNPNFKSHQTEEVISANLDLAIKKILQKDKVETSIDLRPISCTSFEECEQLKIYQRWTRQLIEKNEHRRLSILKASAEGFYLNEALGNPLKLTEQQRLKGLLLLKTVTDLNLF